MNRKSSRRDFLQGKPVRDAAAARATSAGAAAESLLVHVSRRAMACEFEVQLNAGQYDHGTQAALETLDQLDRLEDRLSVFREHSEICQINRAAADEPVQLEPALFDLLELGMRLHAETDGAFDLTCGPLWETWGFARRDGAVPDEEDLAEAMKCVGSHLVELDAECRTVRFREEGVRLNLGGIGKGYALDRCCQSMSDAGIEDYLIHGGGGSSAAAHGCRRHATSRTDDVAGCGWTIGVPHPLRPNRRLAEIRLLDRALATSGSQVQSFVHRGRRYGHILDPRTGWPAEGVLSATVLAPTATLADALSTAFYVMGPDKALEYCETRPEIAALLVCPIRHSGGAEIRTAGLTEDELTLY
ncbi:MAG: FAD:protein FMN transferase [Candidatus Nealsonbacteria bacterium]|nr:FAD:protein FMN transferase [Candidatus Nealsonbacteria bacterium]